MENTDIIKEVIQFLPLAYTYINDYTNTLDISKVVGQEIIKENVKKFYNLILDKFKHNNKEADLKAFVQNSDNPKLEGKVETTIESILENTIDKQELIKLLREVKPVLTQQNNTQNNQGSNNTNIAINTVAGDFFLGNKNIHQK